MRITTPIATRASASHLRDPHYNRSVAGAAPHAGEKGRGRQRWRSCSYDDKVVLLVVGSGVENWRPKSLELKGARTPQSTQGITVTPRARTRRHHDASLAAARASQQDSEHHNTSRMHMDVHPNSPSGPLYGYDDMGSCASLETTWPSSALTTALHYSDPASRLQSSTVSYGVLNRQKGRTLKASAC